MVEEYQNGMTVIALNVKFGNGLHYDPMVELMYHKQLGSIQTYLEMFEEILKKVFLPEDYTITAS